jgi:P-type Cu+ transporter
MLAAVDGKLAALIAVADPERSGAGETIAALRAQGLRVIMVTGDNVTTADAVATVVGGLDEVCAGLLPEDKARIIGELKASGAKVAMAGDGINDAPALAAADVCGSRDGTVFADSGAQRAAAQSRHSIALGRNKSPVCLFSLRRNLLKNPQRN